ncbi:hypothetical protein [Acetobacter sp.]|uniref:hypothetical protein n=1 Tax=Acetobacter sp. TaxID=440 RepID=UPI0039EB1417
MTAPDTPSRSTTRDKDKTDGPRLSPAAEAARQERLAAEAEALRANLRRRKAQARARAEMPSVSPEGEKPSGPDNRPENH